MSTYRYDVSFSKVKAFSDLVVIDDNIGNTAQTQLQIIDGYIEKKRQDSYERPMGMGKKSKCLITFDPRVRANTTVHFKLIKATNKYLSNLFKYLIR